MADPRRADGPRLDAEEAQLVAELRALLTGDPPSAPPEGLDEDRFVALCKSHRLAGVVARVPGAPVPEALLPIHRSGLAYGMEMERRRDDALRCAAEAGIELLVLKGADWAFRLYPDPGMRPMTDVDLLAPPGRTADVVQALEGLGYHPAPGEEGGLEGGYTVGLVTGAPPRIRLEIHPTLCRPTRHPIDVADLFERSVPLAADGPGRRMCDLDGLIYCAVHHALHGYRIPLLWLLDFALLARACGPDEALVERCRALGARRAFATSRKLAEALLGELPLAPTPWTPGGYLDSLISADHLRFNRFEGEAQARAAAGLSLIDRGRLAYLFDALARRIGKR